MPVKGVVINTTGNRILPQGSGEVVGEILNDKGEVVASRHFGIMSEDEFRRAVRHIKKEVPDAIVPDIIELTGN